MSVLGIHDTSVNIYNGWNIIISYRYMETSLCAALFPNFRISSETWGVNFNEEIVRFKLTTIICETPNTVGLHKGSAILIIVAARTCFNTNIVKVSASSSKSYVESGFVWICQFMIMDIKSRCRLLQSHRRNNNTQ